MTGRVSVSILEQVRQANDIVDVVSSYLTLKRAGKSLKGLCPFHREKTPSFSVTPDKQVFHCFGCGVGGDVFKFVQLRESVDFKDALAILAHRAGISLEEDAGDATQRSGPSKVELERANRWAERWFQKQFVEAGGENARAYAASRGITKDSLDRFKIGFAPAGWDCLLQAAQKVRVPTELLLAAGLIKQSQDGSIYDAFRDRLIFPIHDTMNRTIGFGGRTLADEPAKYLNSPQSPLFDKSRCLYGIATAKEGFSQQRTAIVVEGYTDVILAQQNGFENTVATLGTAMTVDHVQMLKRYVDQVVLVFDSDEAGRKAADGALQMFLAERLDVRLACVPEAKDPAELLFEAGSEAFEAVLTSAIEALEFKWNQVRQQYQGAASGPDRRRAIEAFLSLIIGSADLVACEPIQRGLILNQLAKLLGLSSEEVTRQLRILERRLPGSRAPGRRAESQTPVPVPAPDGGAAAMRGLLQVLLNEPGYYESVAPVFDIGLLQDGPTREIARAVAEMSEAAGAFALPELISRFDSPEIAGRIVAMQKAGESSGNYAAIVEDARKRLLQFRDQDKLTRLTASLRGSEIRRATAAKENTSAEPVVDDTEVVSKLRAVSRDAREVHHFAARKHMAGPLTTEAGSEEPQNDD